MCVSVRTFLCVCLCVCAQTVCLKIYNRLSSARTPPTNGFSDRTGVLYYCADKRAVLYALYDHLQYSSQFIFSLHTRVPFLFMGIGLEVFLSCFICQACIYVNIDYFQQLKIIDSYCKQAFAMSFWKLFKFCTVINRKVIISCFKTLFK